MLFAGIDPDLHTLPIAWVNPDLTIYCVWFIRSTGSTEQDAVVSMVQAMYSGMSSPNTCTAVAVEAQEIIHSGPSRTQNPRNILHLGNVAGACLLAMQRTNPKATYFPTPVKWKGSRDKLAHHYQIARKAGIADEHLIKMGGKDPYLSVSGKVIIPGTADLNPGDWKHVFDAVGLAQWAAEQWQFQQKKQELLAKARS